MKFHKCNCMYVPPFVMANLAKRGNEKQREIARAADRQAKLTRRVRAQRPVYQMEFVKGATARAKEVAAQEGAAAPPDATGARLVYDSKHTWEQRVELVRGEGDPATEDPDVNAVYDAAGAVLGYLAELGRRSIDDFDMNLILNVNFGVDYGNAFWDGDEMTFGDGDGEIFTSFAQSLDVVAHELAHGVTQFTANLDYYSQSGALNEHFSDVFGTAITQHALKQNSDEADWLIGNEIMGPTLEGEALRSMKAPGCAYDNPLMGKDPQPAHMDDYYHGPADNRGVHINSGIFNRAFYLVATDQVGTQNAAKIWYHALQNLWSTADFNDAVEVIVNAAQTLTNEGVLQEGTVQTVRLAFKEVGLPT